MSTEHCLTAKVATVSDVESATLISKWTRESGTMLPKSSEDLLKLFENGDSVLIFDEEDELVSHAAITYKYSDGTVEVGCVITDKEKRNNGAATCAVKQVLVLADSKYPGQTIFALANESSSPLFEKIGGIKISTSGLCLEVWEPCQNCPRIPKQQAGKPFVCCDTPYDLTGLK